MHRRPVIARSALLVVLTASLVITASGCRRAVSAQPSATPAPSAEQPAKGGILTSYLDEPSAIDPRESNDLAGRQVDDAIFDSLTAIDPTEPSKLLPSAAETWTANADKTVWTFTLNPADRFHEGTPVTAKDFIYAWNRVVDAKGLDEKALVGTVSPAASQLASVVGYDSVRRGASTEMTGLVAVDDRTLKVTLTRPFADFDYVVSNPSLAPVLRKYVESGVEYERKKFTYAEMPIGNGPFKMSAPWEKGEGIKVLRNDDYYGTKANLDGVQFTLFRGGLRAAFAEFRSGALDLTPVPSDLLRAAVATGGLSTDGYTAEPDHQVVRGTDFSEVMLAFNLRDKTLAKPAVRAAIALAIDRTAVAKAVGNATAADDIIPAGVPGYSPAGWPGARRDLKAAKAAYKAVRPLPMFHVVYDAQAVEGSAAAAVVRDLRLIGIRAVAEPLGETTFRQRLEAGDYQLALVDWRVHTPTADDVLSSLFSAGGVDNVSHYANPAFERGLSAARATTARAQRLVKYRALNSFVSSATPVTPLVFRTRVHIGSQRTHAVVLGGLGTADFAPAWLDQTVAR